MEIYKTTQAAPDEVILPQTSLSGLDSPEAVGKRME